MKIDLSFYELKKTILSSYKQMMCKFHIILLHLCVDSFSGDDFSESIYRQKS